MRESTIESYLKVQTEAKDGLAWKFVSPGLNGVPDELLLLPIRDIPFIRHGWHTTLTREEIIRIIGHFVRFAETKAPKKGLRPSQKNRRKELEDRGFTVHKVDSIEGADRVLFEMSNR